MFNKYPYSLSKIEEIIDNHIKDSQDFLFVCDFALAHYIYDYLANDYGLTPEAVELSSEIDEYYVSMSFYKDGDIIFICESARGTSGMYKYNESDEIDYYIFTGMAFGEAREFLDGKGDMQFCELVEDVEDQLEGEENYMECDCPDCIEKKDKMIYLAESVMHMFEEELCPQCVFEMLQDIYDTAYDSGFEDGYAECKEEMLDFLD